MTQKTPWTFEDYISYIKKPENKNDFHYIDRCIHRLKLCLEPDIIGKTKLYFEKPTLIVCNYDKFEDKTGRSYTNDDIYEYMYDHVYKAICFGNTFHGYSVGDNKLYHGAVDKTEEIWDFVNYHEIDYMNMSTNDYTLIKLYLGTL